MTLFTAILIFIFGSTIGSFISVLIYRIHEKKKGIIFSKSICPSCNKEIKWRHLIPIFSWLLLRGKCAYCGKKFSIHYMLLELITGTIFVLTFLKWNFIQTSASIVDPNLYNFAIDWNIFEVFIFYLIEFTLLIGIFFYDLKYKLIPDRFSLPAIGIGIAGALIFGFPELYSMIIGAVIIFGFFYLQFVLSKGTWIGGGDLRLGVVMGILLGWELGLAALIISYIIGSIISLGLLATKKATRKTKIPFGPFMVTGILITIFYGQQILDWYFSILSF
ncbi:prepilin peptidase [Patescibacteria group bacterium]